MSTPFTPASGGQLVVPIAEASPFVLIAEGITNYPPQ
jgi:hypothetical protein